MPKFFTSENTGTVYRIATLALLIYLTAKLGG